MKSQTNLVCAATFDELNTIGLEFAEPLEPHRLWKIKSGYAAITGVGIPATLIRVLPWIISLRPDLLVNVGIAGAYPGSDLKLFDIALGQSECFADLGIEFPTEAGFKSINDFPFADPMGQNPIPLTIPKLLQISHASIPALPGHGATVNCCTGTLETGQRRRKMFRADFESMEGAAIALAGLVHSIPVIEIRAVSNFATTRDMQPENIAKAIQQLTTFWKVHADFFS